MLFLDPVGAAAASGAGGAGTGAAVGRQCQRSVWLPPANEGGGRGNHGLESLGCSLQGSSP